MGRLLGVCQQYVRKCRSHVNKSNKSPVLSIHNLPLHLAASSLNHHISAPNRLSAFGTCPKPQTLNPNLKPKT